MESPTDDLVLLADLRDKLAAVRGELSKVIVGQSEVADLLLVGLLSGGHSLLVGVPGLAKTLMVRTFARALDLSFSRVQFTPDLMPSDITGTEIIDVDTATGTRSFRFVPGPVFTNVLLSDEINRAPPRTQSALLEAMQEHRVTTGGQSLPIEEPFYVLATQNPIEQEGTYPLPEAQLDRFMLSIWVDYPSGDEERTIVAQTTGTVDQEPVPVMTRQDIIAAQGLTRRVPADERVIDRAVSLARRSRPGDDAPDFIRDWVSWGAGPRAGQYLVLAAKARAVLDGRKTPAVDDVDAAALPVLSPQDRHQLQCRRRRDRHSRDRCAPVGDMNSQTSTGGTVDARRFLDPQVLARLQRLDLIAKHAVEGFMAGLHKSPFHGFSAEFSDHRQYIPGDPPKYLDWKVLARSDRLYLKRFEDETNLQAYLLLDSSGTMAYGDDLSKWEYARMLAASLAQLLLRQRDAVGLVLFDHEIRRWVPARSVSGHLDVLLTEMARADATDVTDPTAALHRLAERLKRRGLVILISDLLLPPAEGDDASDMALRWTEVLKHFRHQGHDVMVLHVLHHDETDFTFTGPVRFQGLEGEGALLVDTHSVGHLYRSRMARYLDDVQRLCRQNSVDYHRLFTSDSLGLALSACLDKRRRLY